MISRRRSGSGRVFIVWGCWGPYHQARFGAARSHLAEHGWELEGVQMYADSGISPWHARHVVGVHNIGLPPPEIRTRPVRTVVHVLPLLFRRRPEVILLPSYLPAWSLLLNVLARLLGIRTVMMNDTHAATAGTGRIAKLVKRRIVTRFAASFLAGQPQIDYFTKLGVDPGRMFVGYDVVDNNHFTEGAAAARANRGHLLRHYRLPDRFMLSLGRLVPQKNLPVLIHAFAQSLDHLGETVPDLVIVGEGPELESLIVLSSSVGLRVVNHHTDDPPPLAKPGSVHFLPYVNYREAPEFMALADVIVLPSISETWGLVVNESMAAGTSVVVSDAVGCVPDLCADGETALVFRSNHAEDLAQALQRVWLDPDLRHTITVNARDRIADWGLARFAEGCLASVDAAAARRT